MRIDLVTRGVHPAVDTLLSEGFPLIGVCPVI